MLLTMASIVNRKGQANNALHSNALLREEDISAADGWVVLFAAVSSLMHEVHRKMGQMLRNRATSSYGCNLFTSHKLNCVDV